MLALCTEPFCGLFRLVAVPHPFTGKSFGLDTLVAKATMAQAMAASLSKLSGEEELWEVLGVYHYMTTGVRLIFPVVCSALATLTGG